MSRISDYITIETRSMDDWEVMYINGEKVLENHRLDLYDILGALADEDIITWKHKHFEEPEDDPEYFYPDGVIINDMAFPDKLKED